MTVKQEQTPPKQGVRARERNAIQRIEALESDIPRLVQGIQQALGQVDSKFNTLSEFVEALVSLAGNEVVQKAIADNRVKRAEAQAQASKDALDNALLEGKLEQIEKMEDGCIITGFEKDKDGNVLAPGYVQLPFDTVKDQFKEKMVGQGAGFSFETEPGGTFEVTGVYRAVPPSQEEPVAEAEEPKAEVANG